MKTILLLLISASFFVQGQNFTFIEKNPDIDKVYSMMKKHLESTRGKKYRTEVFFENLRNIQLNLNDDSYFDINWWLNLVVSYNYPMENLNEFGLTPQGDGSYTVNVKEFPEWVSITTLIAGLDDSEYIDFISPTLIKRGITPRAIEEITKYVEESNRAISSIEAHLSFVRKYGGELNKRFKDSQLSEDDKKSWLLSFNYSVNKVQNRANKKWAKGLLNKMTRKEQRVLIHYLREGLKTRTIYPDDVDGFMTTVDELLSTGKYEAELLNSLASIKEKNHD